MSASPREFRIADQPAGRVPVVITSLVSLLAAAGLGGCAAGPFEPASHTRDAQADLATVNLDIEDTHGPFPESYYEEQTLDNQLPQRWRSEALSARSFEEARRGAAQAYRVSAHATENESLAHADAEFHRAVSDLAISQAEADQLDRVYKARLNELELQATARERANYADAERNVAVLSAQEKEWETQFRRMYAEAEGEWRRARAEFARMEAEREAVSDRGSANIDQMRRVADLTRDRAESKVDALRTEARTTGQQTEAQVASLSAEIQNVAQQYQARTNELRSQANSTRKESSAKVSDLRAQARALDAKDVQGNFGVAVSGAHTALDQAKADAQQLREDSSALMQRVNAETTRLRGQAQQFMADATTERDQRFGEVENWRRHRQAEIDFRKAEADRIESQARAEFVAAEAEAIASSIRAEAQHQRVLSKAEMKQIQAEAEAQAARIEAEVAEQIAEQLGDGAVNLPGNDEPVPAGANSDQDAPAFSDGNDVADRLEPKRVFRFRSMLAESQRIRANEQATQRELDAEFDRLNTEVASWWDQQVAAHESYLAAADSFESKGQADYQRLNLQAEGIIATATAQHDRSLVEAEADRTDTLAGITRLIAEADAIEAKSAVAVEQLLASANAAEQNGQAEVAKLTTQRDSVARRGQARTERLLAEATALEQSQTAVVAQMREEIKAAEQVLGAELERLAKVSQSFYEVAQATYDESITIADTFAQIAEVNATEIAAANASQAEMGEADVEYLTRVAKATELAAQAAVERLMAEARHSFGDAEADDVVARARIAAEARIAQAAAAAQEAIADANDAATHSLFEARLVQTESERNRAYADEYIETVRNAKQVEQSVLAARAYRELSAQAVARFNEATADFRRAASNNWDARLAFPTPQPAAADPNFFYTYTDPTFQGRYIEQPTQPGNTVEFVDVPVTD